MSGKPYSKKSRLKNHTNEWIFQVLTRLWPGNENSYKWENLPGNGQFMTPSIRHIVILPKLQEIQKCWIGVVELRMERFYCIICSFVVWWDFSPHFYIRWIQELEPKWMFQPFAYFITVVLVVLTEAKSIFLHQPVPDGIILLIALSVLSLALQDLLVHRQEISLDIHTLSKRKT